MKNIKQLLFAATVAASMLAPALPAMAQANDQFIAIPSYRVGPYGTNGQSYYGGYVDYLSYVNLNDGDGYFLCADRQERGGQSAAADDRLRSYRCGGWLGVSVRLPTGDDLPDASLGHRQISHHQKRRLAGR